MSCGCKKSSGQVTKVKQVVKTLNKSTTQTKSTPVKRVVKRLNLRRPI